MNRNNLGGKKENIKNQNVFESLKIFSYVSGQEQDDILAKDRLRKHRVKLPLPLTTRSPGSHSPLCILVASLIKWG